MKFYLASSFKNAKKVNWIAEYLLSCGHKITTVWWHTDFKQVIDKSDADWYNDEQVKAISKRNFDGITAADALILVGTNEPCKYNGANIELGYALALGKECYSVGCLERSAMYVPVKKFANIFILLDYLEETSPKITSSETKVNEEKKE
jgi:nucleoside 2-deoxyribosyltransferase